MFPAERRLCRVLMEYLINGWFGALALLAVLLIVVFGIWGPGYDAQAFIYFQF